MKLTFRRHFVQLAFEEEIQILQLLGVELQFAVVQDKIVETREVFARLACDAVFTAQHHEVFVCKKVSR